MKKKTIKISQNILYCTDNELFYVLIGTNEKDMPLHYTVWGKTPEEVQKRVKGLVKVISL